MTTSILDQVCEKQQKRDETTQNEYRLLVKTIANNPAKAPAVDSVDATLRAAGKSVDDLRDDVQRAQYRIGLRAKIADAEKLETEIPGITEGIAAADAALKAAEEKHLQTVRPLRHRRDEINQAVGSAETARRELHSTRPDEYDAPLAELKERLRVASNQKQATDKRLAEMKSAAVAFVESQSDGRTRHPSDVRRFKELQSEIVAVETKATEAAAAVADLLQRQNELLNEILAN